MFKPSLLSIADTVLRAIVAVCIGGLALVVFGQVVARYVLNSPPFWTEELARFLLIWLTFIGAVVVHGEQRHIRIDTLVGFTRGRLRALVEILTSLAVLAVLVVIAKAGFDIARLGTQTAPSLGISMRYVYMALPIGAACMALISLAHIAEEVAGLVKGGGDHVP